MPLTGYLKIPDIDGESLAADHEDEIDLFDIAWRIETEEGWGPGRDRSRARADVGALHCAKWYDASSPYLALATVRGKAFDEVVVTIRKDSGDAHVDYLTITMRNALVSSYEVLGEQDDSGVVQERVSLTFERVKIQYVVQAEDHSAGAEHEVTFAAGT